MNKRQRKKQFKKRYGYNPPKFKTNDVSALIELATTLRDNVVDAINKFMKLANSLVENIKTMPEGEFQEKLNGFTPDQAVMAKLIRYGRKNKVGDQTD